MKVLKEVKHVAYENVEQRRPEKTLKEFQTKFCFTKLNAWLIFALFSYCVVTMD